MRTEPAPTRRQPVGIGWWLFFWLPGVPSLLFLISAFFFILGELGPGSGTGTSLVPFDLLLLTMPVLAAPVVGWLRVPLLMRRSGARFPWLDAIMAAIGIALFGALTVVGFMEAENVALVGLAGLGVESMAIVHLVRVYLSAPELDRATNGRETL